jgi:hypothetical protein
MTGDQSVTKSAIMRVGGGLISAAFVHSHTRSAVIRLGHVPLSSVQELLSSPSIY